MKLITVLTLLTALLALRPEAQAHCQVPCGIYGDQARIQMISEHIDTIEKAMKQITALSKEGQKNYNQIVRWVNTKEHHAGLIQDIVLEYFLAQRVIPTSRKDKKKYKAYKRMLILLHRLIVQSMKAKQSTDLVHVKKLREMLEQFEKVYYHKH